MRSSSSRLAELARLGERPFAHRGLHGGGIVENSASAIEAAVARGYGVEIDVQLSRDGVAMVFHDDRLDRLTRDRGRVAERTAAELQALRLDAGTDAMPRLVEALRIVGGRVPLLIELKAAEGGCRRLCRAVAADLAGYPGPVGVMSFHPSAPAWFAWRAPALLRGLVVTEAGKGRARGWLERRLSWLWGRPDFLAFDVRDLPSPFAESRRRRGVPVYTWTVRGDEDSARAAAHADQIIFELPDG